MTNGISESRLSMWRAVVAMVHADGVVTPHEVSFLNDYIPDIGLSPEQMKVISGDVQVPQDVYAMYNNISERKDRMDFFSLARALSWCDGDFDEQEQQIIRVLEESHMDSENQELLEESRDVVNELELSQDQWKFKTPRSESLFGFLNRRSSTA